MVLGVLAVAGGTLGSGCQVWRRGDGGEIVGNSACRTIYVKKDGARRFWKMEVE